MAKKRERRFIEIARSADGEGFSGTLITRGDVRDYRSHKAKVADDAKIVIAQDAVLNRHHQQHLPIASSETEHLDIEQSDTGYVAELHTWPEFETAQEAKAMMEAGLLKGLSMEYIVHDAQWDGDLRIMKDIEVVDLALVHRPAFPMSQINRAWDGLNEASTKHSAQVDPRIWARR